MNYVQAPFNDFEIGFYLAEPLMVIIAAYTLISRGVDRARRVLRLAVPVRRAAGTARRSVAQRCACRNGIPPPRWSSACGWASISRPQRAGARCCGDRSCGRDARRSSRSRPRSREVHARLALRALCRRIAGDRAVLRARLLPLPLSARRRARRPSTGCISRSAQAPARMRQSVPSVRTFVSGAGDRDRRARSSPPNVSSASIARSNISTTSAARRWCRQRVKLRSGRPGDRHGAECVTITPSDAPTRLAHLRRHRRPAADDRRRARDRAERAAAHLAGRGARRGCRSSRCGTPTPPSRARPS